MLTPSLREALRGRRVLATDLDGTLLRPDHTVSDFTRDAIAAAVGAGIHVVFVTGRPPRWMQAVTEETGHRGEAICANGAVLLDLTAGRISSRSTIDVAAAATVAGALRERYGPAVHFAAEQAAVGSMPGPGDGFVLEAGYQGSLPVPPDAPRMPLERLVEQPDLVKLLARLDFDDDAFWPAAEVLCDGRLEVTHSTTRTLLEFGPAGVTKATALADMAAGLGVDQSDVVAVGDMPNDVSMLDWAGVGLAVSDAHDTARSVALHHVPSPEGDGVGYVLRAMAGLD